MKKQMLAVLVGAAVASPAMVIADEASTRGNLKIVSSDGSFEGSVGGRIHFDAYAFDNDLTDSTSTSEFRRARITLKGKLYNWGYVFENDFAGQSGTTGTGFRDMNIYTKVGPGKLTIGQFKPYRSMEEITSSNDILMMERPYASATGIYNGRQFQQGVGYLISDDQYTLGVAGFNTKSAGDNRNEGLGGSARATFAPIMQDNMVVHMGASYSVENANSMTTAFEAEADYVGRRGPSETIALTTDGESVNTVGLEAAISAGPVFAQAEYAIADFGNATGDDEEVQTYYIQGAYTLTGQMKPYKSSKGVFTTAKGNNIVQLTARYDYIENKDVTDLEAETTSVGVNYYLNPAMRFMLNYVMGENTLTGDESNQVALRAQMAF
ncbi:MULTISPECIES: porin [Alcanivorax]|jgi:phosphate-selective porin OprO/OprP|uniref:Phosphate-selective porin O and P n=2 Tax=Alcanivorax jadensis TaxID=64988 RepID=A0ABR4WE59_9GAMM|nr:MULTISPECIES: porin [Alcanivorax]KGD61665.1 phosphate-selective porin O and P [Alcanivorax jadensis T9]|tara:strand:- start:576 stop:1718 length:1143 start_codon:yes stop_codon:yes gene_type:complete